METTIKNERIGYSPEEAARALGISASLIRKLIKNKSIPSIRLGARRIIIPAKALTDMLDNPIAME